MELNFNALKKLPPLDDKQKGMIKLIVIAMVVLIVLMIVVSIAKGSSGQKVSDEQLKNTMLRAAKKYVEDNSDKMPSDIYGEYEITINTLTNNGYMKDITKYKGKNTSCNGSVIVYYNDGNYSYSARLKNCDDNESYVSLYNEIIKSDNVVESGNGLYYDAAENKYIYKGEYVNNYVSFANVTWRIISLESDGSIRLIESSSKNRSVWDNRYNIDKKANYGINKFEATESSRIKDYLVSYYNNSENFDTTSKSIIIPREYCVGEREKTSSDKNGYAECTTKSELMGVGGPIVSEILNASLDVNCNSTSSASCANYNYFSHLGSFWTLTPNPNSTYEAFAASAGTIISRYTNSSQVVLPVIHINGDVEFKSGTGSETDPYVITYEG